MSIIEPAIRFRALRLGARVPGVEYSPNSSSPSGCNPILPKRPVFIKGTSGVPVESGSSAFTSAADRELAEAEGSRGLKARAKRQGFWYNGTPSGIHPECAGSQPMTAGAPDA